MTQVFAEMGRRVEGLGTDRAEVQIYCEDPRTHRRQWEDPSHVIQIARRPDGVYHSSDVDEVWAGAQIAHSSKCPAKSHNLTSTIIFGS